MGGLTWGSHGSKGGAPPTVRVAVRRIPDALLRRERALDGGPSDLLDAGLPCGLDGGLVHVAARMACRGGTEGAEVVEALCCGVALAELQLALGRGAVQGHPRRANDAPTSGTRLGASAAAASDTFRCCCCGRCLRGGSCCCCLAGLKHLFDPLEHVGQPQQAVAADVQHMRGGELEVGRVVVAGPPGATSRGPSEELVTQKIRQTSGWAG